MTSETGVPPVQKGSGTADIAALHQRIDELEATVARLKFDVHPARPPHLAYGPNVVLDRRVALHAPTPQTAIRIGEATRVHRGAEWIGPITIGRRCFVNRDSYIRSFVTIGDDVLIGPFVHLNTDSHRIGPPEKRGGTVYREPIVIEDGVWIGGDVTIIGGVTIGRGSVIASGAVVVSDIPPDSLAGGVPARVIKQLPGAKSAAGDTTDSVPAVTPGSNAIPDAPMQDLQGEARA